MTCYLWDNGEVQEAPCSSWEDIKIIGCLDLYCVDTAASAPAMRYGIYASGAKDHAYGWHHVPLVDFPKEFRLQLLLLGVT